MVAVAVLSVVAEGVVMVVSVLVVNGGEWWEAVVAGVLGVADMVVVGEVVVLSMVVLGVMIVSVMVVGVEEVVVLLTVVVVCSAVMVASHWLRLNHVPEVNPGKSAVGNRRWCSFLPVGMCGHAYGTCAYMRQAIIIGRYFCKSC